MIRAYRTVIDTPNETQDLTTLDSIKAELGIAGTTEDDYLCNQIHYASQQFASMCNRTFAEETLTDYFRVDVEHDGPLQLSRIPVTEILAVNEGDTALAPEAYEFDVDTGMLWRWSGNAVRTCWFGGAITVQFVAGYELLATLPYDIEHACNLIIKANYFARQRDPNIRSESIPGVMSFDYSSSSNYNTTELARLVNMYRMPAYA